MPRRVWLKIYIPSEVIERKSKTKNRETGCIYKEKGFGNMLFGL